MPAGLPTPRSHRPDSPLPPPRSGPRGLIQRLRRAVHPAQPVLVLLGRFGHIIKGLVYILLGTLALAAALRLGFNVPDRQGTFRAILFQPFGRILLSIVAAGLFAYALWRFIQALLDPDRSGTSLKGIGQRLARAGSGLIYGAIGAAALKTVMGLDDHGDQVRDWTAWGMTQPLGKTSVAIVGLAVIARGLQQVYRAWKARLGEELSVGDMSPLGRRAAISIGRLGYFARGVVFIVVGGFLLSAALRADPSEARGLSRALLALELAPYGRLVLAVVAGGLIAYGIFPLIEARYRRFRTD